MLGSDVTSATPMSRRVTGAVDTAAGVWMEVATLATGSAGARATGAGGKGGATTVTIRGTAADGTVTAGAADSAVSAI